MAWYNHLTSRGYFLLAHFFIAYYVAFYLWGVAFLSLLIYVFTDQTKKDTALTDFITEYYIYIRGLDIIVGFAFNAVIRAVRANVQKREQRFSDVMQRVYVMLPDVASLMKNLPAKGPEPSQASIAVLFYTLIDVILESEDMPELCSVHYRSKADYMRLRHASAEAQVEYKKLHMHEPGGMYALLGRLKGALLAASMARSEQTSAEDLVVRSEMRGIVFAQVWKYLKQLDDQYVKVPQNTYLWARNQPVDVVDSFLRIVMYIYIIVRPMGLVTVATPGVGRIFLASAWYALVVVVVLGINIINSWYELLYNGTPLTLIDLVVKAGSTPIPSFDSDPQATYRVRGRADLWRKYARRLVEAGDLAYSVAAAVARMPGAEESAHTIEKPPVYRQRAPMV